MSVVDLPSRNLKLVDVGDLSRLGRPWLTVHSIRTAFLVCILLVSVIYQVRLGNFINLEIWLPVYGVLLVNFLANSIYLFFFDRLSNHQYWNAGLFGLDTISVTLLIYFTGTSQSLFLFLFLINLILGSLVFRKEGSWLLTMWTSICFSALLLVSPEVSGQSLYFSLVINNVAFVAVTFLGSRLTAQLSEVGTRLQETQTDLVALQNFNDLIVNNVTTGVVVVSRTGFVQYFNPSSTKILEADYFQQLKVQDVVPELEWPWRDLIENESLPYERRDIRIQRQGGVTKTLEVVAARFKDLDGKSRGWILLFDDRTEIKRMEETLRQQEKLAAVGQLAAGIAHEIRNPLASISGSIQLMLGNPEGRKDEDLKLMRIVDKEINRLNGLISEFLEYVRPEQRMNLPVNLNNIVREVVEAIKFNPKLRQEISQKIVLNAASEILGNRDKLKQAILNFVINAYQAMEKTEQPLLHIETFDQPDFVVLIIQDNGCGIKKENLHRIFEPFHTTKPQGTGLGLAVTHKILEAHDARVSVDSTVGNGTKFMIEFPANRHVHTEDLIPKKQGANG